jgi:hypothetical protein
MADRINIAEWLMKYEEGAFRSSHNARMDVRTACNAGWWDWFCTDSSLLNRTNKFIPIIKNLKSSLNVDLINNYVFFKNNCPCVGPTYDSMSICEMESQDVKFWIAYRCPHSNGATWTVAVVKGFEDKKEPDGQFPEFYFSSVKQVVAFLNNPLPEINLVSKGA